MRYKRKPTYIEVVSDRSKVTGVIFEPKITEQDGSSYGGYYYLQHNGIRVSPNSLFIVRGENYAIDTISQEELDKYYDKVEE